MRMADWLNKPTTSRVGGTWFHTVETPAAEAVRQLDQEEDFGRAVRLAHVALLSDPGCIEAHVFLAQHSPDDRRALAYLAKAVATGRELWSPVAAEEEDFSYWGVVATRPFMRALHALGDLHVAMDNHEAAQQVYDELLALNPNDNQGIRFKRAEMDTAAPTLLTAAFGRHGKT